MALNARIHANNPSNAANTPHVLGHETPRTQANDKLLDVRNGTGEATSKFSVDKDGKVSAGGLVVAGAIDLAAVEVDSLAFGPTNLVSALSLLTRISGIYPQGAAEFNWGVGSFRQIRAGDIALVAGRGGNVYSAEVQTDNQVIVRRAVVGVDTDAGRTIDVLIFRLSTVA